MTRVVSFADFDERDVPTRDGSVRVRTNQRAGAARSGTGEPVVLLLHGIPETSLMWHRVAPVLAEGCTVVASDLRGFGHSACPHSAPDHFPYSMRAIAAEQVQMMATLGHDRFAVVGHDRGARCAYRMALDHPDTITHLGVLDVVPTAESFDRADAEFALGYWIWSFLAAPAPVPETVLAAHARLFVDHMLDTWSGDGASFPESVRVEYASGLGRADNAHAVCEQYRAAATLDRQHDAADRDARPARHIMCPTGVLWSAIGPTDAWYDPLDIWRAWVDASTTLTGHSVNCGHFLPEEAPHETAALIIDLLQQ